MVHARTIDLATTLAILLGMSALGCSSGGAPGGSMMMSTPGTDGGRGAPPPPGSDASTRPGDPPPPPTSMGCPESDLGSMLGASVLVATTEGMNDDSVPSCGTSMAAPDLTFTWAAPHAGTFVFDTSGSTFDTILEVRASCGGESRGCDDDGGEGTTSRVAVALTASQRVVVSIDGYGTSSGEAHLAITEMAPCPLTCPHEDLGMGMGAAVATGMLAPDTCSAASDATCGGGGRGGERTFQWTAPTAGMYRFSTMTDGEDTYDTVLSVREGCGGAELACSDDSGESTLSQIELALTAGQSVVVVLDAYAPTDSGRWVLNVERM